ncbi:MAG: lysophospholipid acyltransferase family protein, partial [Myxococcaceae bacterium]
GAFRMALEQGVPLVPIALSGTGDVLPKHGWVMRGTARCRVRVLPPVDPAGFRGDLAAFRDHVRGLIVAEKARLDQEAGIPARS